MSKGGWVTMAGTKACKPGHSSDRRMRHAAVKVESELTADPERNGGERGPAVAKPVRLP